MRGNRIAIPTNGNSGLKDRVSEVFSRAKTFTIVEFRENNKLHVVEILENQASELKHGAGPIAAKTLKEKGVTLVISGELGPGASTLLETININAVKIEPGIKVSQALKNALLMTET